MTSPPVIAAADTGFGNAVNAVRTVGLFERAGVAGLHLENQTFPERCGHLDDKSLVSTTEMDARTDPDLVVIVRTDAIASEGLDAALERSRAYLEAGADVVFVEAPESVEQIELIVGGLPGPKLINTFHGAGPRSCPSDAWPSRGTASSSSPPTSKGR